MSVSTQKKVFLDELITVGDENICCKSLGLDLSLILEWTRKDDAFRLKKKQVLEYYSEGIANRISIASLNALHEVLKHGDRTVTNSTINKEVFDLEGNLHRLETKTVTQKTNPRPAWAIKQGIQLHLLQRLEDSISRSLSTLIENNVIPENLREQILQVLDKNDEQIQNIFSGTVSKIQITEEMLAEIQAKLLGS